MQTHYFSLQEIENTLKSIGFSVLSVSYVQAGHFDMPLDMLDEKAKEILVVAKK